MVNKQLKERSFIRLVNKKRKSFIFARQYYAKFK